MHQLRESITKVGQPYVDRKEYREISRAQRVAIEVNHAATEFVPRDQQFTFGAANDPGQQREPSIVEIIQQELQAIRRGPGRMPLQAMLREQTGHRTERLNWLKPDGKGNLIPIDEKGPRP